MDIFQAIEQNQIEAVKTIIDQCPSIVHIQDFYHGTPLNHACHRGRKDIAQLLIDVDSDINAKAQYGMTPLHITSRYNRLELVELLINAGADINARSEDGWTPLHEACYYGRKEIVQLLTHYRVDWLVVNEDHKTPVDLALEDNFNNLLIFLETIIDQVPDAERKKIQAWRFRQELIKTN